MPTQTAGSPESSTLVQYLGSLSITLAPVNIDPAASCGMAPKGGKVPKCDMEPKYSIISDNYPNKQKQTKKTEARLLERWIKG